MNFCKDTNCANSVILTRNFDFFMNIKHDKINKNAQKNICIKFLRFMQEKKVR